ncbi:uncharacterized protein [Rutidosis leptorrhynchoides]|uniref:uncharacterized protein n=1 Tax=Rutidosis leptorrhynchoides TaxID=125765 RepID=UPI003A99BA5B
MAALIDNVTISRSNVSAKTIRNNLIPQKIGIFIWRFLKGRIAVKTELVKRGIDVDTVLCPLCDKATETLDHSFLSCDFTKAVWAGIHQWWQVALTPLTNLEDILRGVRYGSIPLHLTRVWQVITWTTCYLIWKNRNYKVFNGDSWSTSKTICEIQVKAFEWIRNRSKKFHKDWLQWLLNPTDLGAPDTNNLDPG